MIATPNYLYASFLYLGSSASVYYVRSPRSDGSTWSAYTGSLPFDSGWVWGTSTFDGSHWILVTPNQSTGIWRYVEAP
jgi:hypothetical protein